MIARDRAESELTQLRKQAAALADKRKERATTVHLLAAIAAREGTASELLRERGLDCDACLKAGRTFDETLTDAMGQALSEAKDVARRTRGSVSTDHGTKTSISPDSRLQHVEPGALHVLVALLAERRSAAFRALGQSGIDTTRLRTAALSRALGAVRTRPSGASDGARPSARRPAVAPPLGGGPTLRSTEVRPGGGSVPGTNLSSQGAKLRVSAHSTVVPFVPPRAPSERRPRPEPKSAPSPKDDLGATSPPTATELLEAPASPRLAPLPPEASHRTVHRDEEIALALDILEKQRSNAVCLVGPSGVGKTSIARALAEPLRRQKKELVEFSVAELFAGSAARGSLAERIAALFSDARAARGRVIFIDDLAELLGAGDEVLSALRHEFAQGDVGFVTAATPSALRKLAESEPQLVKWLTPVTVDPPDEETAFLMLEEAKSTLERHHQIAFPNDVLARAVRWSIKALEGGALPEKALAALDLAGARERRLGPSPVVRESTLASVFEELSSIPKERLLESDRDRIAKLFENLKGRVMGHEEPLGRIASQLKKSAAGLGAARPMGSFLLLGPTGVGKTETAKALAAELFGSASAMTRLDLSEYAEPHSIARLVGAPPGYVGHDAGGQLTDAVRKRPFQVVLLDEIEKAHQDVALAFLQVLDEGHMTDGRGRVVDFTNTIIVCTSNLGAREVTTASRGRTVGFGSSPAPKRESHSDLAISAAKKHLPLELFNRFDEVLYFEPLSRAELGQIARRMAEELASRVASQGHALELHDDVFELLLDRGGYDPELGARPMRRTLARWIEGPLADRILTARGPQTFLVYVDDGAIVIDAIDSSAIDTDEAAIP